MDTEQRFQRAETAYTSSIPEEATEKVIVEPTEDRDKQIEYYLNGEKVGLRYFLPSGELTLEYAFRNGVRHGWFYRWDTPEELLSAEPYENGVPHGTAYQWGRNGKLIGTYTIEHGTGIDLWRQDWEDGRVELSEVFYMQKGVRHGWEWWLDSDQKSVWHEIHWFEGKQHGIERQWNAEEHLCRGYPRYWIHEERVTKAKYLRAAAKDPTLPPFRPEDNTPQRIFPPEIAVHLCLT